MTEDCINWINKKLNDCHQYTPDYNSEGNIRMIFFNEGVKFALLEALDFIERSQLDDRRIEEIPHTRD